MWRSRSQWAKAGALVALAFFVGSAHAHYDGDVSQHQHIYKGPHSGAVYRKQAMQACQDYAASGPNQTVVNLVWNSSSKVFSCTISNGFSNVSVNISEAHCDAWNKAWSSAATTVAASCSVRSDTCAVASGHLESWDSTRSPFGFNVPDEAGLPEPWDDYRGCSFKLQGFTPNGQCTRVNYAATGALAIDEDAGPGTLAPSQGDAYASSIPPDCDPDTGEISNNVPQASTSVCAQRAGSSTQVEFNWDDLLYPTPPDPPEWTCIRGCRAVPRRVGLAALLDCISNFDPSNALEGFLSCDFIFPFEDQANYGICQSGTEAPSVFTPRGDSTGGAGSETPGTGAGSGGSSDVSSVTDALTTCDPARGDICSQAEVDEEVAKGEPGQTALEQLVTGGMGQTEAATLDDGAASWASHITGWADGVGATCTPLEGTIMGTAYSIDFCIFAEAARTALYWLFSVWTVIHLYGVWRRASEV